MLTILIASTLYTEFVPEDDKSPLIVRTLVSAFILLSIAPIMPPTWLPPDTVSCSASQSYRYIELALFLQCAYPIIPPTVLAPKTFKLFSFTFLMQIVSSLLFPAIPASPPEAIIPISLEGSTLPFSPLWAVL